MIRAAFHASKRVLGSPRFTRWAPFVLLGLVIVYYAGYIKDDAFISFRYATNWAQGSGLVFNPGDPTEGYTNFLWTAAVALLVRLGIPPLIGAKILGAVTAFLGLIWVRRLASGAQPAAEHAQAGDRAAWLWAASPTVGLWAASAMEPTCVAALAAGTALLVRRAALHRRWRDAALAGIALAACALMRPEGHLLVLAFLPLAPRALPFVLLILVPYHLGRWFYFGDWLPNPFYIKAGVGSLLGSLKYAGIFLLFYGHGLLLALAGWTALRSDRQAKIEAGIAVAFVVYLVYVGWDEMRWFRLYAPALPFLFALAARVLPSRALIAFVIFGLVAHGASWQLGGYIEQGRRSYVQLADTVRTRAHAGDAVLFQDLGAAAFYADKVIFIDPIGLTDRKVARLYTEAGWSPFRGRGPGDLERRIRDELMSRNPRFIALVAYIPADQQRDVRERFAIYPEDTLKLFLPDNSYSHGIPDDPRFIAGYHYVKGWRRNDAYYLVLYERRPAGQRGTTITLK